MSELSDSEVFHLKKWADSGYGFEAQVHVRCLWCDYVAVENSWTEAVRRYYHEHEDVIRAKADETRRDYLGS